MSETLIACHLGRMEYRAAWSLQEAIQNRLIADKRSNAPEGVPHILLIVEHPHVYTLGKSGDEANLLLNKEQLGQHNAEYIPVDRGGDITYHGPGQMVGYPILDLDRFFTDIHRYLRTLEEAIIRTCADYNLPAMRIDDRTGVWIEPDENKQERKICAMGVRCSRWVTMHGWAFNINTDLSYFDHIIPCGIADRGVTSLQNELNRHISEREATQAVIGHLTDILATSTRQLQGDEAQEFLERFARAPA